MGTARPGPSRRTKRRGGSVEDDREADAPPLASFQRQLGNRAVGQALGAVQREPATPTTTTTAAAPTTAAPTTGAAAQPAAAAQEQFPIWDRVTKRRVLVDAVQYEEERARLGRLLRYLVKEVPEDAKQVLGDYPYGEIKELYADVMDDLRIASESYAKGKLAAAGYFAGQAKRYTGFEIKAHALLMEESALSYVGKRVGLAVIGVFQGAADSLLGLIDSGAGLVGLHPGLVEWNDQRYDQIKDAYSGGTGIDHTLVHDDELGQLGGRIAGTLALGKATGGLGKTGQVIIGVQAAAGVKGTVETVIDLRAKGKSWTEIATDPNAIASLAGAVAGVAGVGAGWAKSFQLTKAVLESVGLYATGAQVTALTTNLVAIQFDDSLSDEEKFKRTTDAVHDIVTTVASTADDRLGAKQGGAEGTGEPPTTPTPETTATSEPGTSEPGTSEQTSPEVTERAATDTAAAPEARADDAALVLPPAEAAPAAASTAGKELTAAELLEHHGIPRSSAEAFQLAADQLDVVIKVRSSNVESLPVLAAGGAAKPEIVKVKTANELDAHIGGPSGAEGKAVLFEPTPPDVSGMSPELAAKVQKRYQDRLAEWQHRDVYEPYLADGRLRLEDGVLQVVDPRVANPENPAEGTGRDVGADHDLFDVTHADGSPLNEIERTILTSMFRGMGINVEHGFQTAWKQDSPSTYKPEVDAALRSAASKEGVVAFGPKQNPILVPGEQPVITPARTVGPQDPHTPLRSAAEVSTGSGTGSGTGSDGPVSDVAPSPGSGSGGDGTVDPFADLAVGDEHTWTEEPTNPDVETPLSESDLLDVKTPWTREGMVELLQHSVEGRAALAYEEQLGIQVKESSETGDEAYFERDEGGGGDVGIGGWNDAVEAALAYVHEMGHATFEAHGKVPDAASTPEHEWVASRLAEEATVQAAAIRAKFEMQAALGQSVPVKAVGEQVYVDAMHAEYERIRTSAPDMPPEIAHAVAAGVAEQALLRAFEDGRVVPSTDKSVTYEMYYARIWASKQRKP